MIERVKSALTPPERELDETIRERRVANLIFGTEAARKSAVAELARVERLARSQR